MLSEIQLSVIIPAYNPGKKIIPCINSLEKNLEHLSTQPNLIYEILIVMILANWELKIGKHNPGQFFKSCE